MRVQQGRPARPGIFSCGEHVVAVGGADNGKIGCQVWSLLLRGSGMGGGTSLWSRNVTLSLSLILRVTWWSPSRAPLSTLVWDLRILRVKVMRQCPPSGLSSLGSSWFIRTDGLSFWGLTLMLSRCRVLGLSRVTSLGRAAPPPPSLVPTPQPPFGTLGLWLPATFGSCSRSGVPEKAGNELPLSFLCLLRPKTKNGHKTH